jgi:hypothetical protein
MYKSENGTNIKEKKVYDNKSGVKIKKNVYIYIYIYIYEGEDVTNIKKKYMKVK